MENLLAWVPTVTVKELQQVDQKKRQNIKSRSNMTDDRSEDKSYENESTRDTTPMVQITLKEYDKMKERSKYITDRDLIGCIDKIEELVRALRKHIVRSNFE